MGTDLGTLGGAQSHAAAINNAGQVVGWAEDGAGRKRAFLWRDGRMADLGTLGGGWSVAHAINAAGQVVGESDGRAFLWRDGIMRDLGTLGGASSAAYGINANGQVVGMADTGGRDPYDQASVEYRAFLWAGTAMVELGAPGGAGRSVALGLNSGGEVVGEARTVRGYPAGTFLHRDGRLATLASLVAEPSWDVGWQVGGINDAGLIVGSGTHNGQQRAFLLTPAEPPARCFPETGFCLRGRLLASWEARGGLAINGYPIGEERREILDDGRPYTVQYFERVRMERHPENRAPNDVLLGQFGRLLHPADPPVAAVPGAAHFPETGHNVGGQFLAFWRANGGLPQFGYPLGEEFVEVLEDGKPYTVQYFERARFEQHPEVADPQQRVLLGQFGRRILAMR